MSGYLRWQAERALGLASGVRPARRLPSFAGGASSRSDGVAAFAENARSDFDVAERQFDASSPDLTRPARADAMPATPLRSVEPPRTTPAPDFFGAVSQDADAPRQPPPAPRPQSDPLADRRVEHADRSVIDDHAPPARPAIADDTTPSDVSSRRSVVPQATTRIATRLTRNRPAADRSEARLEAAAAPAPDVHIHIGRVELTAATAAAPPRRESAANAKKPMSLEEYLRRRSGRPS
jgi:hypothetical protein